MSSQPRLIRVFLSSPGDVPEERKIATSVLDALQYDPAFRGRVTVQVVAWDQPGSDTPLLANMNPQEAINQGMPIPADCDVVIVIFWSRMGTPLPPEYTKPNGERYLSGTEWEYTNAVTAAAESAKGGEAMARPRVVIYRRMDKINLDPDDANFDAKTEQWRRVKNFFAAFANPDGSLRQGYNTYEGPEQFRVKFEEHVKKLIGQLIALPGFGATPTTSAPLNLWKGSPFPGLRAFTPDDEPIFYGRGAETDALIERLRSSRFVTVVGASGSGKSSLVAAGVIPRLAANAIDGSKDWILPSTTGDIDDRVWVGARFTPGENPNPFIALAGRLAAPLKRDPAELAAALEADPGKIEAAFAPLFVGTPAWTELVIFIDQFEELLTLTDHNKIAPFIALLQAIQRSTRLRAILTLRADFYARCVEILELSQMLRDGTFPLSAPGTADLYEMIAKPADRAGLTFEDGLINRILEDTGTDAGSLALLAYLLDELYRKSIVGNVTQLTTAQYEALGGVKGAIGKRAEEVVSGLNPDEQAALPRLFAEIVEVDARGRGTRRRAPLDRLSGDPALKRVVDALIAARLLVTYAGEDGRSLVEVAHEALVREWDRLATWITSTQADLLLRSQLEQAAADWRNATSDKESYGLVGDRLLEAQRWQNRMALDPEVADYIKASEGYDTARKAAEDQRKAELIQAEQASKQAAQRATQRTRIAFGVIGVAAVLGIVAVLAVSSAREQTAQADATLKPLAQAIVAAQAAVTQANQQAAEGGTKVAQANTEVEAANGQINLGSTKVAQANTEVEAANTQVAYGNTQVASGNTQVANVGQTLTPILVTLTEAQANNATAAQQVAAGSTQVSNSNNTLTPISRVIGTAQGALNIANATLTPIPITLTAVSQRELSSNLAANAVSLLSSSNGGNSELAALLAIRSLQTHYSTAADSALQNSIGKLFATNILNVGGGINAVAYSPDGNTALTAGAIGLIELWNVQSLAASASVPLVRRFNNPATASIYSAAFSPDGQFILTGSTDSTATVWRVSDGTPIQVLRGHSQTITSVAFSPDSKRALTGSNDSKAIIWDVATGTILQTLSAQNSRVAGVDYSRDGRFAAVGTTDGSINVYDLTQSPPTATTLSNQAGLGQVTSLAFSPDSQSLAVGGYTGNISVWSIPAQGQINSTPTVTLNGHINAVLSVAFSPDSKHLISGSQDQTARYWDLSTGFGYLILSGHTGDVESVAISPDGLHVISGSLDNTARLWQLNPLNNLSLSLGDAIYNYFASQPGQNAVPAFPAINQVAISPDGSEVLAGTSDNFPVLWNINTGNTVIFPEAYVAGVSINGVAFSPDGKQVVDARSDGLTELWDITAKKMIRQFASPAAGGNNAAFAVAFSPDGLKILTGYTDGTAILWDAASGSSIRTFKVSDGQVLTVAFAPDGKSIFTAGTAGLIWRWDAATGALLQTFTGHQDAIEKVVVSADGHYVASASTDRTALLWAISDNQPNSTPLGAPFSGHTGTVNDVAFSPDGQYLVTGSEDHTVRLWKIGDPAGTIPRQMVRIYNVFTPETADTVPGVASISSVAFAPNSKWFVVGTYDGLVQPLEVAYQDSISDACQYLVRDFSMAERQQYGLDGSPTCPQFSPVDMSGNTTVAVTDVPVSSLTPTLTPSPTNTVSP